MHHPRQSATPHALEMHGWSFDVEHSGPLVCFLGLCTSSILGYVDFVLRLDNKLYDSWKKYGC